MAQSRCLIVTIGASLIDKYNEENKSSSHKIVNKEKLENLQDQNNQNDWNNQKKV